MTEKINPVAFKLDLPNRLRMHNVFHVSFLSVYIEGKHPRSPASPGITVTFIHSFIHSPYIPECIEGEYENTIIKHRYMPSGKKNKQVLEYLVKWKGYSFVNDSWEPSASLSYCPKIVK
jgi:hypothetical protein